MAIHRGPGTPTLCICAHLSPTTQPTPAHARPSTGFSSSRRSTSASGLSTTALSAATVSSGAKAGAVSTASCTQGTGASSLPWTEVRFNLYTSSGLNFKTWTMHERMIRGGLCSAGGGHSDHRSYVLRVRGALSRQPHRARIPRGAAGHRGHPALTRADRHHARGRRDSVRGEQLFALGVFITIFRLNACENLGIRRIVPGFRRGVPAPIRLRRVGSTARAYGDRHVPFLPRRTLLRRPAKSVPTPPHTHLLTSVFPHTHTVYFWKRAQILTAETWAAFSPDDVTGPTPALHARYQAADHVRRLPCSADLASPPFAHVCASARAQVACERDAREWCFARGDRHTRSVDRGRRARRCCPTRSPRQRGGGDAVCSVLIDFFLWDLAKRIEEGEDRVEGIKTQPILPMHRTRCIWY
jgi:hypothetical protein